MEAESAQEQQQQAQPQGNMIQQLVRNLKPTLNVTLERYRHTPRGKDMQTSRHIWASNLILETQANIGKDLFYLELWTEYSNLQDAYRPNFQLERDQGKERRSLQFNQFYYTKAFASTDVTLGKMEIEHGTAELFSPADRFNRGDTIVDTFAHTEGVWALRVQHYRGAHTFHYALLPVYEQPRGITKHSRWNLNSDSEDGSDLDLSALGLPADFLNGAKDEEELFPEARAKNMKMMAGWEGKFQGVDLFVTGYHGYSPNAVIRETEHEYIVEYVRAFDLMAGFSATIKKWKFYGESVSRHVHGHEDDSTLTTVLGANYTLDDLAMKMGLKSIELTAEYAWEHILEDAWDSRYPESSRDARPGRDSFFWKARIECTENFELFTAYSMDWQTEYDSWATGFKKRFNKRLRLMVWTEIYGASVNSRLRPWIHNDRYRAALEYTF
jgi:hypothetical protein